MSLSSVEIVIVCVAWMAVPGVPVFSTELCNCSFCMDEKSFNYLTSK